MRITVCEFPCDPEEISEAWPALCQHTLAEHSDLLLLPEFAFTEPVWLEETAKAETWDRAVASCEQWMHRLPELGVRNVVGARPVTRGGQPYNEGFLWSAATGAHGLRSKYHLPDEPGGWEATWYRRGDPDFPLFQAGALPFGLSICTEMWALENCAHYANAGAAAILSPRATAAATTDKWLALGTVLAVRSGAFSLSSNRVHSTGRCGGVGWIIDPDGQVLARTSPAQPYCTLDINLDRALAAASSYPRCVFRDRSSASS